MATFKTAAIAMAVSFLISKIAEALQNYVNRVEIAQQKTRDLASEFDDSNATLESTKAELDEINEKISELNAQDALSFTEKSELSNLKKQREELEKTLQIQEQLNKAKANELAAAAYDEYFTTYGFNGGVTQEAIDKAYQNFSVSSENLSFLFDDYKDSGDLNTLIALMKELESAKEAAFNRNDLDAVADYDTKIKELNTKIWEQIQNLQNLKTYFDTIGYDNLTYYQKNVYDNLQSSIDFAMKLVDPESWNQMQFDSVFSKQTESMQQALMGLAKMGTVTAEQLNNSRFDPFMDELESLGFTAEQVAEQLNALYGKKQSDGDIAPEVTAAQKTVESLVEELSKLQEVQAAQNLGNGITLASYKELVAIDKEYADCIEYQNGQMQLNADKTRELTQEKADEKKATMELAKAQDQMKYFENAQEIENLQRKLKNASLYSEDFADSIYKKIEALESDNSVLQDNITQYDILIGQIDSATSAYTRWLNAQKTLYSKAVFEKLSDAADIGEIKIDVSDVRSTEGKINTLNESIDKLKALHRMKLSAEDAEDVENTLRYCIAQKQMLEAPAVMSVNSADVEEGKQKILELVQQYESAKDELETASALGLDTSEAREKVSKLFEEIKKESEVAGVDIVTSSMEALDEWIAGLSMKAVTEKFNVMESVSQDYIADANGENDGTGTIVYDVDRGAVDKFLKADLDREATLTYKVTTSGTVYVGRSSAGQASTFGSKMPTLANLADIRNKAMNAANTADEAKEAADEAKESIELNTITLDDVMAALVELGDMVAALAEQPVSEVETPATEIETAPVVEDDITATEEVIQNG